jgi:tetratricopeptide (TPR) repeat protein
MNTRMTIFALSGALLLSACSDPQEDARNTVQKVKTAIAAEKTDLDPQKQLDAYNDMLEDLNDVVKDDAKTPTGGALAAGQSVDGVSLAAVQQARDAIAARAACYADPTVDCLRPFSSNPNGGAAASPQGGLAAAGQIVCAGGFAAADKSLADFRVNRDAYAKELIQIGLAAAQCNRPGDVKAAIARYMAADPSTGGQRLGDMMSILATPDLRAAWPQVAAEVEKEANAPGISANDKAGAVLSLSLAYAQMGNIKAALAKYDEFTGALHYRPDPDSKVKIASAVILSGDTARGVEIAGATSNENSTAVILHEAAQMLGARAGVTEDSLSARPLADSSTADIRQYFAASPTNAGVAGSAAALETAVDGLAATAQRSDQTVGGIGLDSDYAILALVYQKLGNPAKAASAIKKGVDLRTRLLGSVDAGRSYNMFAQPAALVAMAQGRLPEAANYVRGGNLSGDSYGRLLMIETGRTQNAQNALTIANTIDGQSDLWHCYSYLIPAMSKAGKQGDVEILIKAWSGNPAQKSDFYGWVVDGMVAAGDVDGAKSYAEAHHMADTDKGKLALDYKLLASKKISADRDKAEPLIRDIFEIGRKIDAAGGESHGGGYYMNRYTDNQFAQNAARQAFSLGYTDLGIELYEKAQNRDQKPLLAAFEKKLSKADVTRILMLGQNNISGELLAYLVDHAILNLQMAG